MADNTTLNSGTGGDLISTDDLTSLNGGVVLGVKVQRVKVGFGSDAALRDVDATNGLPVSVVKDSSTFRGRVNTFRTPGRAGTAGQKIFALHNATGSTKIVRINQVYVDVAHTAAIVVGTVPVVVRIHRFTVAPLNGTVLTKVQKDTTQSSNTSITALGDASADGTGSTVTLTIPIPAGSMLTQEFAPRIITAAGIEIFDRTEFLTDRDIELRALEGIVLFLDYVAAAANPITSHWTVGCDWDEF